MRKILILMVVLGLVGLGVPVSETDAQTPTNLLRDPGFEGEAYHQLSVDPLDPSLGFNLPVDWNGAVYLQPSSETWMNKHPSGYPHSGPFRHGGFRSLHIARGYATFNAVVFQQAAVVPNTPLQGGAWAFLDTSQGLVRAGIDPTGGQNPFAPTVIWSPWAGGQNQWLQVAVSATAGSSVVTLFLHATQNLPSNPNGVYWDDAFLNGTAGNAPINPTTTQPTVQQTGPVVSSNVELRVRRAPDLSAERFGTILPGQSFPLIQQVGQWYQINYNGETGYVAAWIAIVSQGPITTTTPSTSTVASGTLTARVRINVRSGAGTNFGAIGHLTAGQQAQITGREGDWFAINYNGRTGYVAAWLVTVN